MSGDRRGLFITAIALSAFLLFTIELLAGRLVLPVFGGTPGVWATTLSFFTTVLFLGYVYAHFVATRLSPRTGGRVHLGVALAALAALVVSPAAVSTLRDPDLAEPTGSVAEGSAWVVVGREADVERFHAIGWIEGGGGPVLTDDYSDLLRVLIIGLD